MLADLLGLVRFRIRRNPPLQGTITLADNARVMNRNIGAAITSDKAIPLQIVDHFTFPCTLVAPTPFLATSHKHKVLDNQNPKALHSVSFRSQRPAAIDRPCARL